MILSAKNVKEGLLVSEAVLQLQEWTSMIPNQSFILSNDSRRPVSVFTCSLQQKSTYYENVYNT